MLQNKITLYPQGTDANSRELSLIDVDNGKSVRQIDLGASGLFRLTVGHTATKENPTVQTTRHLVRIDSVKPDSALPLKNVGASVQLVIVDPKGDAGETVANLVKMLINFLVVGDSDQQPNTLTELTLTALYSEVDTVVARIRNGEV